MQKTGKSADRIATIAGRAGAGSVLVCMGDMGHGGGMKKNVFFISLLLFLCVLSLSAQGKRFGGMGFMFPDTLTQVTLSGKISIDTTVAPGMYLLDTNGDGKFNDLLNFGPPWYAPDSSAAVRPKSGDSVTIVGGQLNAAMNVNGHPVIIVYQINGNLWRDPYDPIWNDFGRNTHMMGQHRGNCSGIAFGPSGTQAQTVTLTGTVLVDTTFFMARYYLDENHNGTPDDLLNLGPWWYQPSGGATRPVNGDSVTIVGGKLKATGNLNMIIVYQINGKVWRDSTLIGRNFGGGWMRKNTPNDTVMNPYDEKDFMTMGSGWNNGGMMMSDSMFARMLEVNPHNMPNNAGQNIFKAYELGVFNASDTNGMMQNGGCGGMMNFGANATIQFHFNDTLLQGYGLGRMNMMVKAWNNQSKMWMTVPKATIDQSANTITFSTNQLGTYYILTSDRVTAVNEGGQLPEGFSLDQNYPNPFNPSTTISYSLPKAEHVILKIYDINGRQVKILDSGLKEAGSHSVTVNANDFSSGVYFYELSAGPYRATRKFVLMK